MKIVKYTLLTLLALVVIALVAGWLYLEPLVKGIVNKFGTQVAGTEVTLAGFSLHPVDGEVEIKGFTVANPKGYATSNLLSLESVFVKIEPKSLTSDTIVVENIRITNPNLTYEMPNFSTSNVMQLQENVARNTAKSSAPAATKNSGTKEAGASKNVVIRKVVIEKGALSALTPLQKNKEPLTLQLPSIEINGIGDGKKNMTIDESIAVIFNKILFNATSVVTKELGNVSEMAQKAANKALDQVKNQVPEKASGLLDKVKFW